MKFALSTLASMLVATAVATPTPAAVEKRAVTLTGSFGSLATGGFTLYHNNWGAATATSGSQTTTFVSLSSAGSLAWSTAWTWAGGAGQVKVSNKILVPRMKEDHF